MRVRISYSVEMDDIPSEVSDMLTRHLKNLNEATALLNETVTKIPTRDADLRLCAHSLDTARRKMTKADQALSDAFLILSGYVDALEQADSDPPLAEAAEDSDV